jgi:CubicO group peptidase (beta-lactamase class C family)
MADLMPAGTLLVLGAAGGVGSILVQLARRLTELTVIGTASRPESRQWVLDQGAHQLGNHHDGLGAVGPVDYVFSPHSAGMTGTFAEIVRPYGAIVAIDEAEGLDLRPLKSKSIAWHWELMFTWSLYDPASTARHEILAQVAALVDKPDFVGGYWQAVVMASSALHDAMAARVERGEFPGIVTLVARDDDVRVDTIGTTTFGGDVPMRRDTIFRIASMTKPIVAAAAMILVEDDVIDLEEPVQKLLPELAGQRVLARVDGPLDETVPARRPVTVEDLLTFRLGFGTITEPEFDPADPINIAAKALNLELGEPYPPTPHDPDEWIRLFGSLPLMYQPGERWNYNVGTLVLGVLLARAAGQPLGDLLRERLFDPLAMADTGFWLSADRAAQLPGYYMTDPGTQQMGERATISAAGWSRPPVFPSGSGGLVSTADDFLAFARMLLDKGVHGGTRLLSEKSVELMTTNHLTPDQIVTGGQLLGGSGWGLGMAVTVEPTEPATSPGQYGWSGGYGTTWFNDPHERLTGIALTQVSDFLWSGALTEFDKLAYAR